MRTVGFTEVSSPELMSGIQYPLMRIWTYSKIFLCDVTTAILHRTLFGFTELATPYS